MSRRRLRRVLLATLGVSLAGTAALVGFFLAMPPEEMVENLQSAAARGLGMELVVEGQAKLAVQPVPGLKTGGVTLSHPSQAGPVLSASSAVLRPSPAALVKGVWTPGTVHLTNAEIRVPNGWQGTLFSVLLAKMRIAFGRDGTMNVRGRGLIGDRPLSFRVLLSDPSAAMDGRPAYLSADVNLAGDLLEFEGRFGLDPARPVPVMDGDLSADFEGGPKALAVFLGHQLPDILGEIVGVEGQFRVRTLPEKLLVRGRVSGNLRGRAVSAEIGLSSAADWAGGGARDASVTVRGGGLFSGYARGPWTEIEGFAGQLTVSVLEAADTLSWLGIDAADLPVPTGVAGATGGLQITDEEMRLTGMEIRSGGAVQTGELGLTWEDGGALVKARAGIDSLDLQPSYSPADITRLLQAMRRLSGGVADLAFTIETDNLGFGAVDLGFAEVTLATSGDHAIDLVAPDVFGGALAVQVTTAAEHLEIKATGRDIDIGGVPGQPLSGPVLLDTVLNVPSLATTWAEAVGMADLSIFGGGLALPDLPASATGAATGPAETRFSVLDAALEGAEGSWSTRALRISGGDWEFEGNGARLSAGRIDVSLSPVRLPNGPAHALLVSGPLNALELTLGEPVELGQSGLEPEPTTASVAGSPIAVAPPIPVEPAAGVPELAPTPTPDPEPAEAVARLPQPEVSVQETPIADEVPEPPAVDEEPLASATQPLPPLSVPVPLPVPAPR